MLHSKHPSGHHRPLTNPTPENPPHQPVHLKTRPKPRRPHPGHSLLNQPLHPCPHMHRTRRLHAALFRGTKPAHICGHRGGGPRRGIADRAVHARRLRSGFRRRSHWQPGPRISLTKSRVTHAMANPGLAAFVGLLFDNAARPKSNLYAHLEDFRQYGFKSPSDARNGPYQNATTMWAARRSATGRRSQARAHGSARP